MTVVVQEGNSAQGSLYCNLDLSRVSVSCYTFQGCSVNHFQGCVYMSTIFQGSQAGAVQGCPQVSGPCMQSPVTGVQCSRLGPEGWISCELQPIPTKREAFARTSVSFRGNKWFAEKNSLSASFTSQLKAFAWLGASSLPGVKPSAGGVKFLHKKLLTNLLKSEALWWGCRRTDLLATQT